MNIISLSGINFKLPINSDNISAKILEKISTNEYNILLNGKIINIKSEIELPVGENVLFKVLNKDGNFFLKIINTKNFNPNIKSVKDDISEKLINFLTSKNKLYGYNEEDIKKFIFDFKNTAINNLLEKNAIDINEKLFEKIEKIFSLEKNIKEILLNNFEKDNNIDESFKILKDLAIIKNINEFYKENSFYDYYFPFIIKDENIFYVGKFKKKDIRNKKFNQTYLSFQIDFINFFLFINISYVDISEGFHLKFISDNQKYLLLLKENKKELIENLNKNVIIDFSYDDKLNEKFLIEYIKDIYL